MFLLMLMIGSLEWTETTAQDFLSNLGHDPMMYVSQRANLESTPGCVEFFARFDVDNDGYYDVLASDEGGTIKYLRLYKGSSTGFNRSDSIYYRISSGGGGCDLADLSLDGYAELIHSGYAARRITIYWNDGINGPNPNDTTVLTPPNNGDPETVYIYDLDKDTYLDILAADASTHQLIVFWGFPTGNPLRPVGYSNSSVSSFNQGGGEHNIEVGDINRDGWGDIIAGADNTNQNNHVYFWGPTRTPASVLDMPGAGGSNHGTSMADLNNDGWLDIVYTLSYAGGGQYGRVYFYDPEYGTYPSAASILLKPGSCYGGSAVWDWGDSKGNPIPDGYLDIIFFRADPNNRRPPVVYYNQGEEPYFWDSDTTTKDLGNSNIVCSGGFVADFNYDGWWDIYLNAYVNHQASYILYGPDYRIQDADSVPVNADHHGVFREPGNIYNRQYTAWYDSDIFDCGEDYDGAKNCEVTYIAKKPGSSSVDFFMRSGPDSMPSSGWTEWDKVENGYGDPYALRWRYVQYRAEFRYPKPAYLPWLEYVHFKFDPLDFKLKLWPDSVKTISGGNYTDYFLKLYYRGDEHDSFHLHVRDDIMQAGWWVEYWDTAYIDTIPRYIKLDPVIPNGDDTVFYARIHAPEDAQIGDSNITVITTKTHHCSRQMDDSVVLVSKVVAPGVIDTRPLLTASLDVSGFGKTGFTSYILPAGEKAKIGVYDAAGRMVFQKEIQGSGRLDWADAAIPSGLYFVRLERAQGSIVRKVVLTR